MAGPILKDEDFLACVTAVSNALEELNNTYALYIDDLNSIIENNIIVGKTGNSLKAFIEKAEDVQSALSVIADYHKSASELFLSNIDEADQEV